jgi:hypothetical protein
LEADATDIGRLTLAVVIIAAFLALDLLYQWLRNRDH